MNDEKLKKNKPGVNSKQHSKAKEKLTELTEKEVKELMKHSSYKRGPGGSIRQVK